MIRDGVAGSKSSEIFFFLQWKRGLGFLAHPLHKTPKNVRVTRHKSERADGAPQSGVKRLGLISSWPCSSLAL